MDRFLLAENVNKDENRPVYILQTVSPEMIIEVVQFQDIEETGYNLDYVFDVFEYQNYFGITENYMLIVRRFFYLSENEIDDEITVIRNHIKKAWKWWKAYMKKEDEGFYKDFDQDNNLN